MRYIILLLIAFFTFRILGQEVASINNGAYSNNNIIYSIGETYVIPEIKADESNSGLIGVVSRLEFFYLGIDENSHIQEIPIGPNPVKNGFYVNPQGRKINTIQITDLTGKIVYVTNYKKQFIDISFLKNGVYLIKIDHYKAFKIFKF